MHHRDALPARRHFGRMIVVALAAGLVTTADARLAEVALDPSLLANLSWRHIGPAITSGRVVDFAAYERNPKIVYAATATGGVWKTTNNGVTWEALFQQSRAPSLGAIAVSNQDPDLVWVGTGEAWSMRSNSWGNGVHKSTDGGKTWQHMGLEKTQHVGRVLIHPTNPDVVYIAAMGALWSSNEERGVYKTVDGGRTWTRSLYISPRTGVADLAMDPADPDTIYAAAFQRERRFYSFVGGGREGGLYKTVDGGRSWQRLTNGLPAGDMGRIGVSVCRSAPNIVYAAIRAHDGGFYRSKDRGVTWERRNSEVQTHSGYGQVRCDPNDSDLVYVLDNNSHVTRDGGRSFSDDLTPGRAVHVDHHALWINPADSEHMILGNDGGAYLTYDRGRTWDFMDQISVAQFYAIAADLRQPFYYVYGGTQDNSSWGGPSGTRNVNGITNADWFLTSGGDGFYTAIDPTDPDIVYSESQYGGLLRVDVKTGERRSIRPMQPLGGEPYRWNWSAPLLISPHDHKTLYLAANVVFRSRNRGDSWTAISPDLSRGLDVSELPLQGKVQRRDAIDLGQSTAEYGNISTISESPVTAGLLAAGTDDGLVHVTRDGGGSWTQIESFPGIPERPYVTRVLLSRFDADTLYVTFSRHQDNDFTPYVVKSVDLGRTWRSIAGNLPAASVRVIGEHPRNPDLLFVGTEIGVYASNTGGTDWVSLGQGLPTAPVHDLLVHPRENDLIIGTHGRGIWILDDIAILEELTPARLNQPAHLAHIRPAMQFHLNPRNRSSMGHDYFTAPNPPQGAIINLYLNPRVSNQPPRIDVVDASGTVVRRLELAPGEPRGIQRVVWDLRHQLPAGLDPESTTGRRRGVRAPFVLPGRYEVRITIGDQHLTQTVDVQPEPLISITPEERRLWRDTQLALLHMYATAEAAIAASQEVSSWLDKAAAALARNGAAARPLDDEIAALQRDTRAIAHALRRPPAPRGATRSADQDPRQAIAEEIGSLATQIEGWTGPPTADQRQMTIENHQRLSDQITALDRLISERLPTLAEELAAQRITLPLAVQPPVLPREATPPFSVEVRR